MHALCSALSRFFRSNPQYPQAYPQKRAEKRWFLAVAAQPLWIIHGDGRALSTGTASFSGAFPA
jgi:hypothetical protein